MKPSEVMVSHAFGSKPTAALAGRVRRPVGISKSRASPTAPVAVRNCRRSRAPGTSGPLDDSLDRALDAEVGRAAAEVALHGLDDFGVGRLGLLGQQRRRLHDLAGLAV